MTQCLKDAGDAELLTGRPAAAGRVNGEGRRRSLEIDAGKAGIADVRQLVAAAQAGDRSAFGQLYLRYARLVHAIALSRVAVDEAPDVVQDVFVKALRQLPTLHDPAAFGGWIAAIARNTALDAALRSRPPVADPAEPAVPATQHGDLEAGAALDAIRSLPEAYRETLLMRLVEGMTGPEIAERSGRTPASVRVNLHRGMKRLRQALDARRKTR